MNSSLQSGSNTTVDSEYSRGTALILGGGGSAGNAWLIGVIAGLAHAGLDVTKADLIVGTSAGSTAAAQVTGAPPSELFADIVRVVPQPRTHQAEPGPGPVPRLTTSHLETMKAVIAASKDAQDWRRRMGATLDADAASRGNVQARWRETVAARLPSQSWPRQRILLTAVDARTGEPVVFDRDSGVHLVDGVAASCSAGFAYEIGPNRYIDGGFRSNADNADLAFGYERVLVLSPLGGKSFTPVGWGTHLATQLDALRASGSRVETIFPDAGSLEAFGDNLMNPATRPPAARAGYDQGVAAAAQMGNFWHQ